MRAAALNPQLKNRKCSWTFDRAGFLYFAAVVISAIWPPLLAADDANTPPASGNLEPEVTIIRQGGDTMEEYRINGRLYMIKVTPSRGYPYYLMDTNGDGTLDTRRNSLGSEPAIPQWILFRWK